MTTRRDETIRGVEEILRLRRAERAVDAPVRAELRSVREFIEETTGPTVVRAEAARLLGVSQTALDRWIAKGEISSVVTPHGRREIPLSELIALLEDVEEARERGARRPIAAVIRHRQLQSAETVDLDRLLPRSRSRTHRMAELQALAYHRLVAERLSDELVDDARRRVERWRRSGRIDPRWAEKWEQILAMPNHRIRAAISADTPRARELRQSSPFAGVVSEQERRRLLQAVKGRGPA